MNDLIERQAAIETVADMLWHFPNESYTCFNDYSYSEAFAKDALGRLPSAQPERKIGEWIRKYDYYHGIIMRVCKCSVCGANAGIGKDGFWYKSNFCPNCGADMRERKEE